MSRMIRTPLGIAICLAATTFASEGDLLVEGGFAAGSRTYTAYENPNLGGTVSVLKGFNDQTDIGLTASFDHASGLLGTDDQNWTTVGIQSWFTAFNGDIRPQIGGTMGVAVDGDGNAMFHVAGRLRGVMEFTTVFRLFAGAALGTDMGDHGSIVTKGEFGAQFLIR
jgi:hypothetical protein